MARGPRKTKIGTSMNGLEGTSARGRSGAKARKQQEERWAAKAGPVKVYYRNPVTGEERERPPEQL
jgi:ribosomal protein L15